MKANKKIKNKPKYFYSDPINDDFAALEISKTEIGDNWNYLPHTSKWSQFWTKVFRYLICWPILYPASKIAYHTKIVNKKAFKRVKGQGYFMYSNHTTSFDPVHHSTLCNPSAFTAVIASIETFSIKGISSLVSFLGAMPIPLSPHMYKNFQKALKWHIENKHKIVIYPEAHIWPYYTGIRDFKSVSFRYPVELNAPVMVATTTFRKRKLSKRPKVVIYIDGPIYPNKELKFKDQIKDLRDRTYNIMCQRANQDYNYSVNDYIQITKNED